MRFYWLKGIVRRFRYTVCSVACILFETKSLIHSTGALRSSNAYPATYLNDHLAGSVAGLELIDHIVKLHAGQPGEHLATHLRQAIATDRKELKSLTVRLRITQSASRKAVAWASEKLAEVKMWVEDLHDARLRRLELWEALSVGIEGKRLLWRSLASALEGRPELCSIDLVKLEQRADDHRHDVEAMRLKAATAALVMPHQRLKIHDHGAGQLLSKYALRSKGSHANSTEATTK
jgi:hypothetical protein